MCAYPGLTYVVRLSSALKFPEKSENLKRALKLLSSALKFYQVLSVRKTFFKPLSTVDNLRGRGARGCGDSKVKYVSLHLLSKIYIF